MQQSKFSFNGTKGPIIIDMKFLRQDGCIELYNSENIIFARVFDNGDGRAEADANLMATSLDLLDSAIKTLKFLEDGKISDSKELLQSVICKALNIEV